MPESGRYLYAVTRGLPAGAAAGLRGIEGVGGAPVQTFEHRALTVLVSTVDLAEFGEEPLRRNLEDMAWLERTARAHDGIVRVAAGRAATAPLRMLTICHDDRAVAERLDALYDDLIAALDRVEGRHEWSVKLILPPESERRQQPSAAPAGAGGGAAYLRAKKAAAEAQRAGQDAAARTAQEVYDELIVHAAAGRRLRPQDPRLSGLPGTMTLNAAYLVDDAMSNRFAEAARALADQHPAVDLLLDGPWPPYSFAMTEES